MAAMSTFQVPVTVSNPHERARSFEERFWVDTGAYYTFIPEDRLQQIGITPIRSRKLVLADGRVEECQLGEAVLFIPQLNEALTCQIAFAPVGSLYLLGATALENFAVQADPTAQQLKPLATIIIGGFLATRL